MYLVLRNSTLLRANNKGADQPAHPHSQLALESMIAKPLHAKKKRKENSTGRHVCAEPDNGVGGLLLKGSSYQFFFSKINNNL